MSLIFDVYLLRKMKKIDFQERKGFVCFFMLCLLLVIIYVLKRHSVEYAFLHSKLQLLTLNVSYASLMHLYHVVETG